MSTITPSQRELICKIRVMCDDLAELSHDAQMQGIRVGFVIDADSGKVLNFSASLVSTIRPEEYSS